MAKYESANETLLAAARGMATHTDAEVYNLAATLIDPYIAALNNAERKVEGRDVAQFILLISVAQSIADPTNSNAYLSQAALSAIAAELAGATPTPALKREPIKREEMSDADRSLARALAPKAPVE